MEFASSVKAFLKTGVEDFSTQKILNFKLHKASITCLPWKTLSFKGNQKFKRFWRGHGPKWSLFLAKTHFFIYRHHLLSILNN